MTVHQDLMPCLSHLFALYVNIMNLIVLTHTHTHTHKTHKKTLTLTWASAKTQLGTHVGPPVSLTHF